MSLGCCNSRAVYPIEQQRGFIVELAYLDPASSGIIVSAVVAGFGSLGVAWRSLKMRVTGATASGEGEDGDADEDAASEASAK